MASSTEDKGDKEAAYDRARPEVEEVTIQQATRVLREKGFNRVIQVRRDPSTGKILDLFLRE